MSVSPLRAFWTKYGLASRNNAASKPATGPAARCPIQKTSAQVRAPYTALTLRVTCSMASGTLLRSTSGVAQSESKSLSS